MKIIKDTIEKLLQETDYIYQEEYEDEELNSCYNYWYFLEKNEEELRRTKNIPLETILYSKYYWFSRLVDGSHQVYGPNVGMDQQLDMILDEIDQRLTDIDWEFVEKLYYRKV